MEWLSEHILKSIPASVLPWVLITAVGTVFLYFWYGYRNYTDLLQSRAFMTLIVAVVASGLLFSIHGRPVPRLELTISQPLLLVPDFEDDEGRNYKNMFLQQVRAAFSSAGLDPNTVVDLSRTYISDRRSAELYMKEHNGQSAVFGARVNRVEDKVYLCIYIVMPGSGGTYAPTFMRAEIQSEILDNILKIVAFSDAHLKEPGINPLLARLDSLEQQLASLNATVMEIRADRTTKVTPRTYNAKHAVVVGINGNEEGSLPHLRYAETDAMKIAESFQKRGFDVQLLINPTSKDVLTAFHRLETILGEDDLLAFYFAGSSFQLSNFDQIAPEKLMLPMRDFRLSHPTDSLDLETLARLILALPNRDNFIVIDGCHGTSGLDERKLTEMTETGDVIQVLAGSQDNEVALEGPEYGGGMFTHVLVGELARTSVDALTSMSGLAAVAARTMKNQRPKLLSAGGDIQF